MLFHYTVESAQYRPVTCTVYSWFIEMVAVNEFLAWLPCYSPLMCRATFCRYHQTISSNIWNTRYVHVKTGSRVWNFILYMFICLVMPWENKRINLLQYVWSSQTCSMDSPATSSSCQDNVQQTYIDPSSVFFLSVNFGAHSTGCRILYRCISSCFNWNGCKTNVCKVKATVTFPIYYVHLKVKSCIKLPLQSLSLLLYVFVLHSFRYVSQTQTCFEHSCIKHESPEIRNYCVGLGLYINTSDGKRFVYIYLLSLIVTQTIGLLKQTLVHFCNEPVLKQFQWSILLTETTCGEWSCEGSNLGPLDYRWNVLTLHQAALP